jgi:TolB-like protein/DNA-binding SARP family transcriptional activator/Flp pilus assembly protein TadD
MLHLETFGGLSVASDGAHLGGAAQQRKPLALLALLAAAGRTGLSRDKVLAYLWPEADAEHARGLLKQGCYALRRDLRAPDLFLDTTQLRLNPDVITSDVQAFEAALERGNAAQAAELYGGPFLDGFYLSDAVEFERWVEAERRRLRERATAALERLATEAAAGGDQQTAVVWWRRLAALDPLNSHVVVGLMNALAAAGDRAGALQAARVHESLLREEVGVALDPAVVDLTERLRAEAERSPSPRPPTAPEPAATQPVPPGGDATEPGGLAWKPARVGLALVVAGLLTGGWFLLRAPFGAHTAETARAPKRIVVLPFTNLGPVGQEYFADGITEEITARLAAVGDLRVIGTTSATAYKGTTKTILDIGRELGVAYILEGSVRWEQPSQGRARVRVTPQLVSTADGTHRWAEVYDEPLDEIFRVQSDIAQKVVQALDVSLLEPERRVVEAAPTRNLEAYDYYLRGNDYQRRGSDEGYIRAALRMYERAVERDSLFAPAYALLSRMHSRMYWAYYDRSPDRLVRARRAVDKALELEPDLPEAHHSLGTYYWLGFRDYERALREFGIAAARRPNESNIFIARAALRTRQGDLRGALVDYEKARQLDPASATMAMNYGECYDRLRDFARADALFDRAIALSPDWSYPYYWKAWLYVRWRGSTTQARQVMDEAAKVGLVDQPRLLLARIRFDMLDRRYDAALRLSTTAGAVIEDQFEFLPRAELQAQIYGLLQRRDLEAAYYDSARAVVSRKLREQPDDPRLHSALGIAYAGLGRTHEAIQEGEKAVELLPVSKEAFRGYYRAVDLARIYATVGERDAAVAQLEHLVSIPGHLTAAWLRIDPTWDPLRSHPRFQQLVGGER